MPTETIPVPVLIPAPVWDFPLAPEGAWWHLSSSCGFSVVNLRRKSRRLGRFGVTRVIDWAFVVPTDFDSPTDVRPDPYTAAAEEILRRAARRTAGRAL